eukprot:762914-Hanusia_phi.AAC.8
MKAVAPASRKPMTRIAQRRGVRGVICSFEPGLVHLAAKAASTMEATCFKYEHRYKERKEGGCPTQLRGIAMWK